MLKPTPIKIVTTLHGTDITLVGLEPSFLPVMRLSIEESDGVTAVSRFLKEKTITNYGINKAIEVIPNFVDIHKYARTPNPDVQSQCAPHGEKILVHTSNFRPVKRVPDVIRIFHKVLEKIESRLILVGDGPERSICEHLTRELGSTSGSNSSGASPTSSTCCHPPICSSCPASRRVSAFPRSKPWPAKSL